MFLWRTTCDLGLNLALHLQRVYEDTPVSYEASTCNPSVRLAETFLVKILSKNKIKMKCSC